MNLDGAVRDLDTLTRELRLRPRQRAFVEHLQAGLAGWKAAQAAGYPGTEKALSVAASRALGSVRVQRYRAALEKAAGDLAAKRTRRAIVSRAGVLRRLSAQADADMGRYLVLGDRGEVQGFRVRPDHTRAVRSLKLKTRKLPAREPGGAPILEREVELSVADPVRALALLAEHYKLVDGDERDRERTVQVQVNTLLQQADPESLRQAVLSQSGRGDRGNAGTPRARAARQPRRP